MHRYACFFIEIHFYKRKKASTLDTFDCLSERRDSNSHSSGRKSKDVTVTARLVLTELHIYLSFYF